MKIKLLLLLFVGAWIAAPAQSLAQTPPATAAPAAAAPPPAAPAKRSAAELEKLVAPIALYPDPLIATMLPASVYPLEIVQAARFVLDTNNLAKLDEQPWDDSVKAIARVPDAIKKMNDDLPWTIALGEAFLAQDKDLMDAIQNLRGKAQKAGTLQTTPQQVIVVTNTVVEKTVEQQVVVVTNTIVQIQPATSVVYVPAYNPVTVYYPPPAYVYDPYAPLVTFAAGVAVGAIIANNCDWHHGGCYYGGGDVDVDVDVDRNVNRNTDRNTNRNNNRNNSATTRPAGGQKKWQPDQNRLAKSGSPGSGASARTSQARGWGASPSTGAVGAGGARPSTGAAGAGANRPSTGAVGARPSTGTPTGNRPSPSAGGARPTPSASPVSRPATSPNASPARSSSPGAFGGAGGGSGISERSASSRGAASRSGGFGGGGGSRGGGGRGGGGGRR